MQLWLSLVLKYATKPIRMLKARRGAESARKVRELPSVHLDRNHNQEGTVLSKTKINVHSDKVLAGFYWSLRVVSF